MKLDKLLDLTRGPHKLRVALIGETGAGKTAKVKAAANALGLPITTLLLSQTMPEDVAGLPKVERDTFSYVLNKQLKALVTEPGILFLDELDKARPETVGAVLTLLWDYEVHGEVLHPETIIVAAMQPVPTETFLATETGKALAARLIMVDSPYDWGFVEKKHAINLDEWPTPPAVPLPISQYPSPRQTDLAIELMAFTTDKELKEAIAFGTHPEPLANILLAPREGVELTPKFLLDKLNENAMDLDYLEDTIGALEQPELMALMPSAEEYGHPEVYYRLLRESMRKLTDENFKKMFSDVHEHISALDSTGDQYLPLDVALDKVTFDICIDRGWHPYTGEKLKDGDVDQLYKGIGPTLETYKVKMAEVYGDDL